MTFLPTISALSAAVSFRHSTLPSFAAPGAKRWQPFRSLLALIALWGLSILALPVPTLADVPGHVLIADDGAADINGVEFGYFDAPRAVNDAGEVYFKASDYGVSGGAGFWKGTGGVVQALAKRGMPAPGGGVYRDVVSFTADHIATPEGYAVFMAKFRVPPSTVDVGGLYLVTPTGTGYRLAYEGQAAPGGGTFREFQFATSWGIGPGGKVVFYAETDGGAGGGYYYARLNGTTPVVSAVALHGDTAPGTEGTFRLSDLNFNDQRVAVNDAGLVTFRCTTTTNFGGALYQWNGTTIVKIPNSDNADEFSMNNAGTVAFLGSNALLRVGTSVSTQVAVNASDTAPGGGTFGGVTWGKPLINESGQVVFVSYGKGIFMWSAGTVKAIAVGGQSAPGGGTMNSLSTAEPILTNTGYVIFKGGTSGGDRIFMSDGTEIVAAVSVGDQVAGEIIAALSMGTDYSGQSYFANQGPANNAGQICYKADLKPSASANVDRTAILRFTPSSRWWTGGSGTWDGATHWKFSLTPNSQRDVIVDPSADATVTGPAADATVRTLQIGGGDGTTRFEVAAGTTVASTNGTTVTQNGVLAGPGRLGGALFMDGNQELASNQTAQSLGAVTYTNRSHLSVMLLDNSATWGGMTASAATIEAGAQVDLKLNASGSTVDFTLPFWQQRHTWKLISAPTITGAFVLGQGAVVDSAGHASGTYGSFTLVHNTSSSPKSAELRWAPLQTMPTVTTEPLAQIVGLNTPFSLTVDGTGNALAFQWFRDNSPIPSATSSSFNITSAALANAGTYKAVLTNDIGNAPSASVYVGVVNLATKSVTVEEDKTLTLTVSAAAPAGKTFNYQWKKGAVPLTNGSAGPVQVIAGADKATMTITRVDVANAGSYSCTLSLTGAGSVDSGAHTVTVTPESQVPSLPQLTQPVASASVPLAVGADYTVMGSAKDNHAVDRVQIALRAY